MDDGARLPREFTPDLPPRSQTDRLIAEMISRLLSHYWAAGEPEALRRAQALDWLDDLREFGSDVVAYACGEWRRSETKRPTIADLRRLCAQRQYKTRPAAPCVTRPFDLERRIEHQKMRRARDEEAAQSREIMAREYGFPDFKAAMEFGLARAFDPSRWQGRK